MPLVVVERVFDEPEDPTRLQAREDAVAWCLEQYDVRFLWTYFARDRRRMVCIYQAPDAESVRHTQRTAGLPVSEAWTAGSLRRHLGQRVDHRLRPGATAVVVQRIQSHTPTLADMEQSVARGAGCLEENDLDLIDSYVPLTGRRMVCIYAGPDAETVRRANRTLQLSFERAWPTDIIIPAPSRA